jgi:hypothetical protein
VSTYDEYLLHRYQGGCNDPGLPVVLPAGDPGGRVPALGPAQGDRAAQLQETQIMTEAELLELVTELAKWLGLLAYHTRDSRRSAPGFPDLVLAGRKGVIFAELKSPAGGLKPDQVTWKYMLLTAGQAFFLWRPADWESGLIQAELRAIA